MTDAVPDLKPRSARLPRDARRAQLLEVALGVFVDQGYHAASMDDIAVRAGVSKPVLYQHFPGKLDLYLALLEFSVDTVIAGVRRALASTEDNKERVQATMVMFFDYVADSSAAFRLVYESDLTNEPLVAAQLHRVTTETAEAIADVIAHDTALTSQASHMLATSLAAIGREAASYWLANASEVSKEDAVALVSTLAWRGIAEFPLGNPTPTATESQDAPDPNNDEEV